MNDYGQTLSRLDRERLQALIAELQGHGVSFVYLASWHDPFGDPKRYARAVFSAWGLPPDGLLAVFLRGTDRRWRVEGELGPAAAAAVPPAEWAEILVQARIEANRLQPAGAVTNLAGRLLEILTSPPRSRSSPKRSWAWAYVLGAVLGLGALVFLGRVLLCPHCLRPLRRRPSFRGILRVCPRCRYTRAGLR